jgi:hypothetical protein
MKKKDPSAAPSSTPIPKIRRDLETESDGKLTPAEAEAVMSGDLPSGDPELSPPAASGDASPDFVRDRIRKAS